MLHSGISHSMSARLPIRWTALVAGVACCLAVPGQAQTGYSGKAYGTKVTVAPGSSSITSGTTAASQICTESTGVSDSNSVAGVSLTGIATTGVVDTSVSSATVGSGSESTALSTVNGLSLLGGLVTADVVTSASSSIFSSGGYSTSSAGTKFTNAKVLGLPILIDVAPNTRIVLPGIGFVLLNEQISKTSSTSASLTVNAIHIHITLANALGLPVGSQIVVTHAQSGTEASIALLSGFAYGTEVRAAGVLDAGRSADVVLNCTGDDSEESNNIAGVDLPGIVSTGAVHTTAVGTVSVASTNGQTTASVAGLNLLSGLVAATAITADATASTGGSGVSLSDSGSIFVGLAVTGHPEIVNPAANTHVSIAGLGTLWLHRVIQTSTSIEVRMVELVVDADNTLGLQIGADVRVAVAKVGLTQ